MTIQYWTTALLQPKSSKQGATTPQETKQWFVIHSVPNHYLDYNDLVLKWFLGQHGFEFCPMSLGRLGQLFNAVSPTTSPGGHWLNVSRNPKTEVLIILLSYYTLVGIAVIMTWICISHTTAKKKDKFDYILNVFVYLLRKFRHQVSREIYYFGLSAPNILYFRANATILRYMCSNGPDANLTQKVWMYHYKRGQAVDTVDWCASL